MDETKILKCITEYFASIEAKDVNRYVSCFAPNGVLEDPVSTPPHRGHQGISDYTTETLGGIRGITFAREKIFVCGNQTAVKWTSILVTKDEKEVNFEGIGIFEFNNHGKLTSVKEYYDLQDLMAKMGQQPK